MSKSIIDKLQEISDNPPSDASSAHYSQYAEEAMKALLKLADDITNIGYNYKCGKTAKMEWDIEQALKHVKGLDVWS